MPPLKQLSCFIKWSGSLIALKEVNTQYSDGRVETYLPIPELPTSFYVHLSSKGYIAPGIAMFVYIDGVYQCNRNRYNLKIPDGTTSPRDTEIDFRVRQKEVICSDGTIWGEQWTFEKPEIGFHHLHRMQQSGKAHGLIANPIHADDTSSSDDDLSGTIEVVVLRCTSREDTAEKTSKLPSVMDMKGFLRQESGDSSNLPLTGIHFGSHSPSYAKGNLGDWNAAAMKSSESGSEHRALGAIESESWQKKMFEQRAPLRPVIYAHKIALPDYIDDRTKPYAVFVFKYLPQAALERMFNVEVTEPEEVQKLRLTELSKEDLIEQYLKIKQFNKKPRLNDLEWDKPSMPMLNLSPGADINQPTGTETGNMSNISARSELGETIEAAHDESMIPKSTQNGLGDICEVSHQKGNFPAERQLILPDETTSPNCQVEIAIQDLDRHVAYRSTIVTETGNERSKKKYAASLRETLDQHLNWETAGSEHYYEMAYSDRQKTAEPARVRDPHDENHRHEHIGSVFATSEFRSEAHAGHTTDWLQCSRKQEYDENRQEDNDNNSISEWGANTNTSHIWKDPQHLTGKSTDCLQENYSHTWAPQATDFKDSKDSCNLERNNSSDGERRRNDILWAIEIRETNHRDDIDGNGRHENANYYGEVKKATNYEAAEDQGKPWDAPSNSKNNVAEVFDWGNSGDMRGWGTELGETHQGIENSWDSRKQAREPHSTNENQPDTGAALKEVWCDNEKMTSLVSDTREYQW